MVLLQRRACVRTQKTLRMSIVEITLLKMAMTTIMLLIPAILVETVFSKEILHEPNFWVAIIHQTWYLIAFIIGGIFVTALWGPIVFCSSILDSNLPSPLPSRYQTVTVALIAHVKAISAGIVQEIALWVNKSIAICKISFLMIFSLKLQYRFPQILVYSVLYYTQVFPSSWQITMYEFTPWHIAGTALTVIGSVLYGCMRILIGILKKRRQDRIRKMGQNKFLL